MIAGSKRSLVIQDMRCVLLLFSLFWCSMAASGRTVDAMVWFVSSSDYYWANSWVWLKPDGSFVEIDTDPRVRAGWNNHRSGRTGTYTLDEAEGDTKVVFDAHFPTLVFETATRAQRSPVSGVTVLWHERDSRTVLANVSTRALSAPGHPVIAGFSLTEGRHVLVRAVGPGLRRHGVAVALTAPVVSLYTGEQLLHSRAAWNDLYYGGLIAGLQTVSGMVGAFPLNAADDDCALLIWLPAGTYTVHAKSDAAETAEVLVEVYALPYGS